MDIALFGTKVELPSGLSTNSEQLQKYLTEYFAGRYVVKPGKMNTWKSVVEWCVVVSGSLFNSAWIFLVQNKTLTGKSKGEPYYCVMKRGPFAGALPIFLGSSQATDDVINYLNGAFKEAMMSVPHTP